MAHLARLKGLTSTYEYVNPDFDLQSLAEQRKSGLEKEGSCQLCSSISIQELEAGVYMYSISYLKTSSAAGCQLCSLMLHSIASDRITSSKVPVILWGNRRPLSVVERKLPASTRRERGIERLTISRGHRSLTDPALALVAEANDPAAAYVHRRPEFSGLDSDEAFDYIRALLNKCINEHPYCKSQSERRLPSRLLDVGPSDGTRQPTLVTPDECSEYAYVALSYSWGGQQEVTLTKSKANGCNTEFPLDSLPQTLQDAVKVTRRLGFSYLWVDALCIIQDDGGADFQIEAGRMDSVYSNAVITIAANTSLNVRSGVFAQNIQHDLLGADLSLRYEMPGGTLGKVTLRYEPAMHGQEQALDPLNKRGWTLQERLLSRRSVIYRSDQISWDCLTTTVNSKGPLEFFDGRYTDSPGRWQDDTKRKDYWSRIVENYTRRNLTRRADKLKALSGMARRLQVENKARIRLFNASRRKVVKAKPPRLVSILKKSDPDEENPDSRFNCRALHETTQYHAGMWINDIEFEADSKTYDGMDTYQLDGLLGGGRYGFTCQLLWEVAGSGVRARPLRAPTFSWASIDGAIDTRSHIIDYTTAKVIRVNSQPVTQDDPYGEVSGGSLVISGHVRQFRLPSDFSLGLLRESSMLEPGMELSELYTNRKSPRRAGRAPLSTIESRSNARFADDAADLTDGTPGDFWRDIPDLTPEDRKLRRHNLLAELAKDMKLDVADGSEVPDGSQLHCLQITDKFHLVLMHHSGPQPKADPNGRPSYPEEYVRELSWEGYLDFSKEMKPPRRGLRLDRHPERYDAWTANAKERFDALPPSQTSPDRRMMTSSGRHAEFRRVGVLNHASMPFESGSSRTTIAIV